MQLSVKSATVLISLSALSLMSKPPAFKRENLVRSVMLLIRELQAKCCVVAFETLEVHLSAMSRGGAGQNRNRLHALSTSNAIPGTQHAFEAPHNELKSDRTKTSDERANGLQPANQATFPLARK